MLFFVNHQCTPFAKAKHLLPVGAWAAWHNESNQSELENEFVIVYEGSTVLNSLNLDFPFDETEHFF